MAKKDLSEFGWGRIIDTTAVTSVSRLIFIKNHEDKPSYLLTADIGGVKQEFVAPNVKVGWFNDGQPDPDLLRLRDYLISCMK